MKTLVLQVWSGEHGEEDYAVLPLAGKLFADLRRRRQLARYVRRADEESIYCEFVDYRPTYIASYKATSVLGFAPEELERRYEQGEELDGQWCSLLLLDDPPEPPESVIARTECDHMVVHFDTGVHWTARHKYSEHHLDTESLTWDTIDRLFAACGRPIELARERKRPRRRRER